MQTGMNPGPGCSWLGALWWRRQFCDSQPVELRGESDLQVERLAGFELGDPCELGGVVGPFAVGLAAAACGDGDDEADERLRLGCGAAGCWFGAGDFGLQGSFAVADGFHDAGDAAGESGGFGGHPAIGRPGAGRFRYWGGGIGLCSGGQRSCGARRFIGGGRRGHEAGGREN